MNDITVDLPSFTLNDLESSSSEEDSSISANDYCAGSNDDNDDDDVQFLRTRTQILKRRQKDNHLISANSNCKITSARENTSLPVNSKHRFNVSVQSNEFTRDHSIDQPDVHEGNELRNHDIGGCSSSRDSGTNDGAQHHFCDIEIDHKTATKPLQKTYMGLRRPTSSPFLPPSVTKIISNRSMNSMNRGTFSPEKRYPRNKCIDLVEDVLVDSTASEESDDDDDDELIVLPPPPKNSNRRNGEIDVVNLNSDSDEELSSRLQRNRRKMSIVNTEYFKETDTSILSQNKTSVEPSSSLSWLPQWKGKGSTPSSTPSTRVSNRRTSALTSRTISPHELTTNYRNDLKGGSGTGLGGVIVLSNSKKGDDVNVDGDTKEKKKKKKPGGRVKRKASSKAKTSTKTKKKGKRKRGGWGGRKKQAAKNDNGGAWSARERGIRPYKRGRGTTVSSTQPYMDISRLDPNLGNVGGASIKFE